jgi:hypothetical protein
MTSGPDRATAAVAAKNFQQAQGLEPVGQLTLATISSRGMSKNIMAQGGGGGRGAALFVGPAGIRPIQQTLNQKGYAAGTELQLSPAAVRRIQQALNRRSDVQVRPVDGTWNASTRAEYASSCSRGGWSRPAFRRSRP